MRLKRKENFQIRVRKKSHKWVIWRLKNKNRKRMRKIFISCDRDGVRSKESI